MRYSATHKFLLIPFLVLIHGCQSAVNETDGTPGGMMDGCVTLLDSVGRYSGPAEGCLVEVGTHKTLTNAFGDWSLSGVPAGIYDIAISKPGYGKVINYSQFFPGGYGELRMDVKLSQEPPRAPRIKVRSIGDSLLVVSFDVDSMNTGAWAHVALCDSISLADRYGPHLLTNQTSQLQTYFRRSSGRFKSGDTVYLSACYASWSVYPTTNPVTDATHYPSLSPRSNVEQFVWP
jgi:hypothetical protein